MKGSKNKGLHENYLRRVELVQRLTAQYYEPERLDRCYMQVWRHKVYPLYPCCYRTYLKMLKVDVPRERERMRQAMSRPEHVRWVQPGLFYTEPSSHSLMQ
ncbi:hypothetical protein [uncultured Porphyromonas sp.]|jgi:hypothetical protein|uniref:hypothetical protein n=1 Tax=Porphyromonas sp. TaxID=1924944 RepID=UPI002625A593|nr:hypothetical protein [uncultured Porphyromonas sp.]